MNEKQEKIAAASLARTITMTCVRNTFLEDLHAGCRPVTETGDYSDVKVIDARGEVPWAEISRLDDAEMKKLMKQIVNRIYTYLRKLDDPDFREALQPWTDVAQRWDTPELDRTFLNIIEDHKARRDG